MALILATAAEILGAESNSLTSALESSVEAMVSHDSALTDRSGGAKRRLQSVVEHHRGRISFPYLPSRHVGAIAMDETGGIQLLLAAEQDAQRIVVSARAGKTQRLRQAKEEAEREIAGFRAQREEEFKKKQDVSTGSVDSNVKRLEEETDAKIQQLTKESSQKSNEVTSFLLKYVTTVKV
ncbi:hypothetical protein AXG93_3825s1220 [Marchantia polymorpha subsp. ruderalis]|uniref:V-type proton ATPase subunit G n=2 Tax=Marchantia polymorpha TaxID=3197 RepID=A0A176WA06_MARPO|nr:hypothetical protein AXG93_3825s1220 [Marchantia polymorpha subsp. ruderalis]